jgi:AraC-like DNA-binding protein
MSISARTLRRRLAENQTTFSEVFENWRISNARHLLLKRDISVARIAALLGYSHSSNFERAFKRWTGISPSDFRAPAKRHPGR